MNEYGKEVEASETINHAREFLASIGADVEEKWKASGIKGINSVRVSLSGTHYGTNGKGRNHAEALASAFGEMIERLGTGIIFKNGELNATQDVGFIYAKNEVAFSPDYFLNNSNVIVDTILEQQNNKGEKFDGTAKHKAFEKWNQLIGSEWISLPFRNIRTGEIVYVPHKMLGTYGSNGMAAGNTQAEAFVQATSEIIERYCQGKIIRDSICPPPIKFEAIEQMWPEIAATIRSIEYYDGISVEIKDCSLGKALPTVCAVITNKRTHRNIVSFGAHPVIRIAITRALTEAFQGRDINNLNNFINDRSINISTNIECLFSKSTGYYPYKFYSDKYSYHSSLNLGETFLDNEAMQSYLINLLSKTPIFMRTIRFQYFTCVHVIIPTMSEISLYDAFSFECTRMKNLSDTCLKEPDNYNKNVLRSCLEYVDYARKTPNTSLLSRHINLREDAIDTLRLLKILIKGFYRLHDYRRVINYAELMKKYDGCSFWDCLITFMQIKIEDLNLAPDAILNKFYDTMEIDAVHKFLKEPLLLMMREKEYTSESAISILQRLKQKAVFE